MAVENVSETLRDRLDRDYTESMKARDAARLSALRLLRAAIQNGEKAKGSPFTGEELEAAIAREVKVRRESVAEFGRGGRSDLVASEEAALEVLTEYMPAQLSDAQLIELITSVVGALDEQARLNPRAALGQVMRIVMPRVRGTADGDRVRAVTEAMLNDGEPAAQQPA